jgi:hypothetical protein
MTELENKALRHSLELLKDFSYGNIYSGLNELLKKFGITEQQDRDSFRNNFAYLLDRETEKVNAAKEWITTVINNK